MKYKIEVRYTYGWDDAGWTDEFADEIRPTRFDTEADAELALAQFLEAVNAALDANTMVLGHDRDDYRIVRVDDDVDELRQ